MYTKRDYLNEVKAIRARPWTCPSKAHRRYYGEIVQAAGGFAVFRFPGTEASLRKAYEEDPVFNNIPLREWDFLADAMPSFRLSAAFRERGDYATLAGLTCVLKEAARQRCEAMAQAA